MFLSTSEPFSALAVDLHVSSHHINRPLLSTHNSRFHSHTTQPTIPSDQISSTVPTDHSNLPSRIGHSTISLSPHHRSHRSHRSHRCRPFRTTLALATTPSIQPDQFLTTSHGPISPGVTSLRPFPSRRARERRLLFSNRYYRINIDEVSQELCLRAMFTGSSAWMGFFRYYPHDRALSLYIANFFARFVSMTPPPFLSTLCTASDCCILLKSVL